MGKERKGGEKKARERKSCGDRVKKKEDRILALEENNNKEGREGARCTVEE